MTIFLVLSNFKHDGILYAKDSFFEGDAGTFVSLVADGVLKKIEGASTFEEAQQIIADQKAEEGEEEVSVEPKDTWGPSPEAAEAPVTTEEITTEPTEPIEVSTDQKAEEVSTPTDETKTGDVEALEKKDGDIQTPAENAGDNL